MRLPCRLCVSHHNFIDFSAVGATVGDQLFPALLIYKMQSNDIMIKTLPCNNPDNEPVLVSWLILAEINLVNQFIYKMYNTVKL
jgi:hypothetical protein